jgi:DNA-binding GntR family transcriptional regulator
VRKSLFQPEGEQLVTTSRDREASVRGIDVEFVGSTCDIVIPLGALLTRRAAERMTPLVLERLTAKEVEEAAGRLDGAAVVASNNDFHSIISEHVRDPEAARIVDCSQELLRAIRRSFGLDPTRLPGMIADHRSLLCAFADRDVDEAAAVAAGHAAKTRSDLIAIIRHASPVVITSFKP